MHVILERLKFSAQAWIFPFLLCLNGINSLDFSHFWQYSAVTFVDIVDLHQVYEEFRTSSQALSVEKLIETFVEAKSTGTDKPG